MARVTDKKEGLQITLPLSLTIKDVITIITVAVSIALAWGVYGTRLSLLEERVVYLTRTVEEQKQIQRNVTIDEQQILKNGGRIDRLEDKVDSQSQDIRQLQDKVYK